MEAEFRPSQDAEAVRCDGGFPQRKARGSLINALNPVGTPKMPRETKAQRLARQEQERAAREAQERAGYFPRVMELLVRATNLGWEIKVLNVNGFELHDRDNEERYTVFVEYDAAEVGWLDHVEVEVAQAEFAREEANRKELARRVALAKLTDEERKLLGLNPYLL
jgi:hypothetical protein